MSHTEHVLSLPEVDLAYDVHNAGAGDEHRPIVMIGQPMDASGFHTLASLLPERRVFAYDPRGLGRSVRKDGRVDNDPDLQARDVHALIAYLDLGPVDMFASSGGAITALPLVGAHPEDIAVLVAHEPPLLSLLPDVELARRAEARVHDIYDEHGWGAAMAAFIAMGAWQGPFTEEFFAQPVPGPEAFGMPADDDGTRTDPLLSRRSLGVTTYVPDDSRLREIDTQIVVGAGEESIATITGRGAVALAQAIGHDTVVFPSHHGGFLGGDFGYAGQPEAFALKLREILLANA